MSKLLKHKEYYGSSEVSIEDNCLCGKILYIDDLVTYEAQTVEELRTAFQEAVEDYIQTCEQLGREAKKPFSGTFNIRVGKDLHHRTAIHAASMGSSINDLVKTALTEYLKRQSKDQEVHKHYHLHNVRIDSQTRKMEIPGEVYPWSPQKTEVKMN